MLACRNWHKNTAAALLGGLQTDPQFHANGIRLDWLLRLVLSKANGRHKPTRYDLSRVLNAGLEKAGVLRLEDPNEDLFCELIVSERGNFRIFSGQWELGRHGGQSHIGRKVRHQAQQTVGQPS